MPQLNWTCDDYLASKQWVGFRSRPHGPTDENSTPNNSAEIRFNKLTDNDGKRFLDITVQVAGRPAHYTLDRDQIEALKVFLAGPDTGPR